MIITHQHIDHLGLVDIVAKRSGAEVSAIDVVVPFVENFGSDADRDDEEAAELMLRHGISQEVVTALRQVTGSFRAWGSKTKVTAPFTDGEVLEFRDRALEVQLRPGPQPVGHGLLGRGPEDPDRRRPPDQAHLLEPAHLDGRWTGRASGGRRWSSTSSRCRRPGSCRPRSCSPVTASRSLTTSRLIDERFALHQRRAGKLYSLIVEEPRTGHELAQELWGDVAVTQAFLTLSEIIGHVDLLINADYVREVEEDGVIRYQATSDATREELGDLIPGGNPATA